MTIRSCKVTIRDMQGVDHVVHVTASGLYEAIALGLASLQGQDWVGGIASGLNEIRVSVVNVPVEHTVKMHEFNTWLGRRGRTPKEITDRYRVREILGITEEEAAQRSRD